MLKKLRDLAAMKPEDRRAACLKTIADPKSTLELRQEAAGIRLAQPRQIEQTAATGDCCVSRRAFLDPKNGFAYDTQQMLDYTIAELDVGDWSKSAERREIWIAQLLTPSGETDSFLVAQRRNFYHSKLPELILQDTAGIPPRLDKAMQDSQLPMQLREVIIEFPLRRLLHDRKPDPAIAKILDTRLPQFVDNADSEVLRLATSSPTPPPRRAAATNAPTFPTNRRDTLVNAFSGCHGPERRRDQRPRSLLAKLEKIPLPKDTVDLWLNHGRDAV